MLFVRSSMWFLLSFLSLYISQDFLRTQNIQQLQVHLKMIICELLCDPAFNHMRIFTSRTLHLSPVTVIHIITDQEQNWCIQTFSSHKNLSRFCMFRNISCLFIIKFGMWAEDSNNDVWIGEDIQLHIFEILPWKTKTHDEMLSTFFYVKSQNVKMSNCIFVFAIFGTLLCFSTQPFVQMSWTWLLSKELFGYFDIWISSN